MNRIELKCRCGAEAVFETETGYPSEVIGPASDWMNRHDACPQMLETFRSPVPAAATRKTFSFPHADTPACQHEWEMGTAGHQCRKCGVQLNPPSFTTAVGGEESPG